LWRAIHEPIALGLGVGRQAVKLVTDLPVGERAKPLASGGARLALRVPLVDDQYAYHRPDQFVHHEHIAEVRRGPADDFTDLGRVMRFAEPV
jgi:hypothetical protein